MRSFWHFSYGECLSCQFWQKSFRRSVMDMIVLVFFGILSLIAIAGTIVALARDGYGRRPTITGDNREL